MARMILFGGFVKEWVKNGQKQQRSGINCVKLSRPMDTDFSGLRGREVVERLASPALAVLAQEEFGRSGPVIAECEVDTVKQFGEDRAVITGIKVLGPLSAFVWEVLSEDFVPRPEEVKVSARVAGNGAAAAAVGAARSS